MTSHQGAQVQRLEIDFARGRLSRREFLYRATALGLGAGALGTAFARDALAGPPNKGGTLRLGLPTGSSSDVLDPRLVTTTYANMVNMQLRNCLTEIDAEFNVIPELAESWDVSSDASKWVFRLRKGVEFHNGKTLDAEDVVYSLNLHRGEDSKSAAKGLVKSIESVKANGKDEVVIKLSGGSADFPYILSDFHLTIVPAGAENFDDGMGTGAYILEVFEPGVRAIGKLNPNYWKEGRGHFEAVESINVTDETAKVSALVSGSLDAAITLDPVTVDRLAKNPAIQVIEVTGTQHVVIPMLVNVPPFDNPDVRLAMKFAIDREQIVRTLLGGHGAIGNDHPIVPAMRFFADDIPQRAYDPDQAKFHLKKAGFDNLPVALHTTDAVLGLGVNVAELYKEHAAAAGLAIDVVREPSDGYWSNVWQKKPFSMSYWGGRPTCDYMFSVAYAADAPWNETKWKNPRFNELLVKARAELDDVKRAEMYRDMQLLLRDDGGTVIPFFLNYLDGVSDKIGFGQVAGNFPGDGYRCAERWWFV